MSDDAQSLIAHAQGLITIYADDVQQAMLDGVYGPLSDAFDRSAPFDAVARAWWAIPGGSFGTGRGMALAWIWRRLLKGGNPAELLKSLEKMLSEKSYTARVIRPFSGVTTEYCQFLTKKTSISPNTVLQKEWPYSDFSVIKFEIIISQTKQQH